MQPGVPNDRSTNVEQPSDLGGHLLADASLASNPPHVHQKSAHTAATTDHTPVIGPIKHLPSEAGFPRAINSYWQQVSSAKSHHKYVTAFPPVYSGMDDPRPAKPPQNPVDVGRSTGTLPSLNDLIDASKDLERIAKHDKSKPDFQLSQITEDEFKKRYAAESVFVGKEFNLDKYRMADLVERIYAFEDGGWGTHDTLSSMPQALTDDSQKAARMAFHPVSSAIGYNQLLMRATVTDIIQHGDAISARLETLAKQEPTRAAALHEKAQLVLELQDALEHPNKHNGNTKGGGFAEPSKKLEEAVHSLNLDGDIGPVLQSQELYNLLRYSTDNHFVDSLTIKAALDTTRAKTYDTLTPQKKDAAINQIFDLIKPSELHPEDPTIGAAFDATKAALRQKFVALDTIGKPSALAHDALSPDQLQMMNSQILTIRRFGGQNGPLSTEAAALLDRVAYDYFGGFTASNMQPAAIELGNLSGMGMADDMLKPEHANLPTSNFFARNGYMGNPVTSRRSADELLMQIYRVMHGPNAGGTRIGINQFDRAFSGLP